MRLLREPLFHFLVIGAALFGAYRLINRPRQVRGDAITISSAQLKMMITNFVYVTHRPPSRQEMDSLIDEQVGDEVLVREARALGLDQEDGTIRERLREKMRFIYGDSLKSVLDRSRAHYVVNVER